MIFTRGDYEDECLLFVRAHSNGPITVGMLQLPVQEVPTVLYLNKSEAKKLAAWLKDWTDDDEDFFRGPI